MVVLLVAQSFTRTLALEGSLCSPAKMCGWGGGGGGGGAGVGKGTFNHRSTVLKKDPTWRVRGT